MEAYISTKVRRSCRVGEDYGGSAEDKDEADWRQHNASWYVTAVKRYSQCLICDCSYSGCVRAHMCDKPLCEGMLSEQGTVLLQRPRDT